MRHPTLTSLLLAPCSLLLFPSSRPSNFEILLCDRENKAAENCPSKPDGRPFTVAAFLPPRRFGRARESLSMPVAAFYGRRFPTIWTIRRHITSGSTTTRK